MNYFTFCKFPKWQKAKEQIKIEENIAEKANIKDFSIGAMQGNVNVNSSDMLFFLGTKALDAQIDNLTKESSFQFAIGIFIDNQLKIVLGPDCKQLKKYIDELKKR